MHVARVVLDRDLHAGVLRPRFDRLEHLHGVGDARLDAALGLAILQRAEHAAEDRRAQRLGHPDAKREVLLGGATDGSLWRIDPTTGRSTSAGTLSTGWGISGDMVSIRGANTYATVRRTTGTSASDTLATLDFSSGSARIKTW